MQISLLEKVRKERKESLYSVFFSSPEIRNNVNLSFCVAARLVFISRIVDPVYHPALSFHGPVCLFLDGFLFKQFPETC